MKSCDKFVLVLECSCCSFRVVRSIELNRFGYYEFPQAVCPHDFATMDGGIKKECELNEGDRYDTGKSI